MKEIERLTNYTFFYNNGDFDLKRIVSVAAVRKPVSEVVRQMLPDSPKCGVGWGALWTALPCTRI